MLKPPIKTAVVGLGRAGWYLHADQVRKRNDFRLVDVADPAPERRKEAAEVLGCRAHPTLDCLLEKTRADLVVIATPSFSHEMDSIKVLESGRHCLVEKPMAMNFAGARRMIAAARKAKRKLFVHQNYRFGNEYLHFREILDSGVIGRVFEIRTNWLHYARRNDWQTLRGKGGGVLNNTCPHVIDMILHMLGSPVVSLLSDLQHIKDAGNCEDHVHLFMKARNGCAADMTVSSSCALTAPRWMLFGANGTVSSDGKQTVIRCYDPRKVRPLSVVRGAAPGRKYGNQDVLPWEEETRPIQPLKKHGNFYDNVADVLLRGKKMVVTPEDAAEVIHIIEWARKDTSFPAIH